MQIAILRCGKLPSFVTWDIPNLDELFEEDRLLLQGFGEQGVQARSVVWNDPQVDWSRFDAALVRSTWDYLDEREQFLQVLSQVEASPCRLFNPLAAVRWNIDKHYLFDLAGREVPVVPTLAASDIAADPPVELFAGHHAEMLVLKPTVGLGGSHSYRLPREQLKEALERLAARRPQQEYLVQPYIEEIVTEGEWSFIYFNRRLSHVLLKRPAPGDYRVQGIYGGTIQAVEPRPGDLSVVENVMAKIPFDVLYARLDFVRVRGQLSVMEVELIEPIFSFNLVPAAIPRFVHATLQKLENKTV